MYFTLAERRKGSVGGKWRLCQVAFDTQRRHLYVSEPVTDPQEIAPPAGTPLTLKLGATPSRSDDGARHNATRAGGTSRTEEPRRMPRVQSTQSVGGPSPSLDFEEVAPPSSAPVALTKKWKSKIRVELMKDGKNVEFSGSSASTMHQVLLYGEYREVAKHETPSEELLLCPSTSLAGLPERYSINNTEFVRDPHFLRELYDSLHQEFTMLQTMRDSAEGHAPGETTPSSNGGPNARLTLRSPRTTGGMSGTEIDRLPNLKEVALRFRCEFEFQRFWFVLKTVMGYDKLCSRPYRGLPPYDLRNYLMFATVSMHAYRHFRGLDKSVFYAFVRGDLVGYGPHGDPQMSPLGVYLCIMHDMIAVLNDSSVVVRHVAMTDVCRMEYNVHCSAPFVAFLSDTGASEVLFHPRPPAVGEIDIAQFNPQLEVVRIVHVIRTAYFSSIDVRRAISIAEATETTTESFLARVETELGRRLDLHARPTCLLPSEAPVEAWRQVTEYYAQRNADRASLTAIPLYEGHPNSDSFDPELLTAVETRLTRSRTSDNDLVGLSAASQDHLRERISAPDADDALLSVPVVHLGGDSSSDGEAEDEAELSAYGIPGSTYLPSDQTSPVKPSDTTAGNIVPPHKVVHGKH